MFLRNVLTCIQGQTQAKTPPQMGNSAPSPYLKLDKHSQNFGTIHNTKFRATIAVAILKMGFILPP
jgi:hypothetical protein